MGFLVFATLAVKRFRGHKTMAQLHADNRYDRLRPHFEVIVGRPATRLREYVAKHPEMFGSSQPARVHP